MKESSTIAKVIQPAITGFNIGQMEVSVLMNAQKRT